MSNTCLLLGAEILYYPAQRKIVFKNDSDEIELDFILNSILRELIDNQGAIVSKDTLIETIWQDYPGAQNSLHNSISRLRTVLRNKDIIKTHPKLGYSFQLPVIAYPPRKSIVNKPIYVVSGFLLFCLVTSLIFTLTSNDNMESTDTLSPPVNLTPIDNKNRVELSGNPIIRDIKNNPEFSDSVLDRHREKVMKLKDSLKL